jgi:hypothetical protein
MYREYDAGDVLHGTLAPLPGISSTLSLSLSFSPRVCIHACIHTYIYIYKGIAESGGEADLP